MGACKIVALRLLHEKDAPLDRTMRARNIFIGVEIIIWRSASGECGVTLPGKVSLVPETSAARWSPLATILRIQHRYRYQPHGEIRQLTTARPPGQLAAEGEKSENSVKQNRCESDGRQHKLILLIQTALKNAFAASYVGSSLKN